jgi:uncharacterized protein (TIGR03067 family)
MRTAVIVLSLGLATSAGAAPRPLPKLEGDAKAELKKLQGVWFLTSATSRGVEVVSEREVTIAGDKLLWRKGEKVVHVMTIRLGRGPKHWTIDLKGTDPEDDEPRRGIYRLWGDTLTICDDEPGEARPKAFDGEKHALWVFKRGGPRPLPRRGRDR